MSSRNLLNILVHMPGMTFSFSFPANQFYLQWREE